MREGGRKKRGMMSISWGIVGWVGGGSTGGHKDRD